VPLVVFSRKSAIELAGSLASPGPSRHDCARHDICAFEVRLSMTAIQQALQKTPARLVRVRATFFNSVADLNWAAV
jgi:hypothetical protein